MGDAGFGHWIRVVPTDRWGLSSYEGLSVSPQLCPSTRMGLCWGTTTHPLPDLRGAFHGRWLGYNCTASTPRT